MKWAVIALLVICTDAKKTRNSGYDKTKDVVEELRNYVNVVVEPAIQMMEVNESSSRSPHDCFSTTAGRLLRSRCCVYFSNVAGSLIEAKYGKLRPPRGATVDLVNNKSVDLAMVYQLTAKWLLANPNDPLAIGVRAEKIRSIDQMHQQANKLQGPTGRYQAPITVAGVSGRLIKCEMSSTHTYLVFQSDNKKESKDVIIDVTYQQFLIITEWMGSHVEELVRAAGESQLFSRYPKTMVGTDEDFEDLLTEESLQSEMDNILSSAGYASSTGGGKSWPLAKPWDDQNALRTMNHLRNNVMLTLHNTELRNQHCGLPTQALESNPGLREML
jgi:hypothetical protein